MEHSNQRDVLMLGAEGCLGGLLREPQQIKERDRKGGDREERERERERERDSPSGVMSTQQVSANFGSSGKVLLLTRSIL